MLQFLPNFFGRTFKHKRAGKTHSLFFDSSLQHIESSIIITSDDFSNNEHLKSINSADESGLFPKINWSNYPSTTKSFLVVVEDLDSPTLSPLLHLVAYGIPATKSFITHFDIIAAHKTREFQLGRNSMMKKGWMPPDPPPGHGAHRYLFEVFGVDAIPNKNFKPKKHEIKEFLKNHGLSKGMITGLYERK